MLDMGDVEYGMKKNIMNRRSGIKRGREKKGEVGKMDGRNGGGDIWEKDNCVNGTYG